MATCPPPHADLETKWVFLKEGLDLIMNNPQSLPQSYLQHMKLYSTAYDYCTTSRNCLVGVDQERMTTKSIRTSSMLDLYDNLTKYFAAHLEISKEESEPLHGEPLLQYYAAEWDRYTTSTTSINRHFSYFNRHLVKCERRKGRRELYPVYTLSLVQWKSHFLTHVQSQGQKLTSAIIGLVKCERNGQDIDQGLVKKVVESFVTLGVDQSDLSKVSLDVYEEHFAIPFLEATDTYYKSKSEAFLAENSIFDYLKKAEEWMREEEDRVERYLNASTHESLINKCGHALIWERSELLQKTFQDLIDDGKDDDMQRMCAQLAQIHSIIQPKYVADTRTTRK